MKPSRVLPSPRPRNVEIEPEPDAGSPGVVGEERVGEVDRVDGRRGVHEGREQAHVHRAVEAPAGRSEHRVHRIGHRLGEGRVGHQAGTADREAVVVVRESLAEPQRGRRVRPGEVERLQLGRADPLHVPGMEELVRRREQKSIERRRQRAHSSSGRSSCGAPCRHLKPRAGSRRGRCSVPWSKRAVSPKTPTCSATIFRTPSA